MALSLKAPRLPGRLWAWSPWSVALLLAGLAVAFPLGMVLASLFQPVGPGLAKTQAATIGGYLTNSLILVTGTACLTGVTGVACAWLVSACEFRGRRLLGFLLVIPLALPAYVVAFGYGDLLDRMTPVVVWLREVGGLPLARAGHDVLRYSAVIAIFSSVLYPYVYLAARFAFRTQSHTGIEAARMLGQGPVAAFFRVSLPLAWPAIAGGMILVGMEVINDYGAVEYFGIPTLTIGIFRFWFSFGDADSAARIAAWALLATFVLLGMERLSRGRRRFSESGGGPCARYPLRGGKAAVAAAVCTVPVFIGFIVPVWRLTAWSVMVGGKAWDREFLQQILMSLLLAGGVTLLVVGLAVVLAYAERLHGFRLTRWCARLAILGYAIPSAVLALGVLRGLGSLDRMAGAAGQPAFTAMLLSGSVGALVFACVLRFLAVGFLPAQAGLKRVCDDLDASARSLGSPPLRTLLRINLPLLKPALWAAAILVFVDVLKELPLTLLLRPFNFETLATRAFNLVDQGRLPEAAPACLLIVAMGLAGVFVLNHMMEKDIS